jgi:hypothetical protein
MNSKVELGQLIIILKYVSQSYNWPVKFLLAMVKEL